MTNARPLIGERYAIERRDGGEGPARRYRGTDDQLDRGVLAWVVDGPEGAPGREALLATARAVARAAEPLFLHVLDIVPEPARLAVILEAPPPRLDAAAPSASEIGAHVLALGEALERAATSDLRPARLTPEALTLSGTSVRADPIAVCFDAGDVLPAPAVVQLADLLHALLNDDVTRTAIELRRIAGRHRDPAAAGDLGALLDALHAALRGPDRATEPPPAPPAPTPPPPAPPAPARAVAPLAEIGDDLDPTMPLEQWPPPRSHRRRSRSASRRLPVLIPAAAAVLVLLLGGVGLVVAAQTGLSPSRLPGGSDPASSEPAPPLRDPDPGRVTVGLMAQEDSSVRITVDGVVEFDGVLGAGESQLWEGGERIQVRTDRGRSLLLSVNGRDLGPFSPAMGEPDWNLIDFGFWPGWGE